VADPYRSETEQLRQRVEDLEHDLEEANAKIARLEGIGPPSNFSERFFGGPLSLSLDLEVDGEIGPERHEELADRLTRYVRGSGQAATVGRSLRFAQQDPQVGRMMLAIIRPSNGKTRIALREKLNGVAGGLFGGVGAGAGLGLLSAIVPFALWLGLRATIPLVCVAWLMFVYACVRWGFRKLSLARRRDLDQLGRQLVAVCEATPERVGATTLGVRAPDVESVTDAVLYDADREREAGAEAENEASEVAQRRARGR